MITEATIRRIEAKTAAYRKDAVERLVKGMKSDYWDAWERGFQTGCNGVEEIYQEEMQHQLQIEERRREVMKKKKSPSKLKLAKTAKAKKALKAKKK